LSELCISNPDNLNPESNTVNCKPYTRQHALGCAREASACARGVAWHEHGAGACSCVVRGGYPTPPCVLVVGGAVRSCRQRGARYRVYDTGFGVWSWGFRV